MRSQNENKNFSYWSPEATKKLLERIQERGGLRLVRVEVLCKDYPNDYGDNDPVLKRRVQNKINDFKFRPFAYEELQREHFGDVFDSLTRADLTSRVPTQTRSIPRADKPLYALSKTIQF